MGSYLTQPVTTKHVVEGQVTVAGKKGQYCATSMQGWRTSMEDAHITRCGLQFGVNVFGVFDGHGGPEVALFCEKNFVAELLKTQKYQQQNFAIALRDTFLRMDDMLMSPNGKKEIAEIRRKAKAKEEGGARAMAAADDDEESMAGCTANVCLITDRKLYVANAGDSRTVILTRNGATCALSVDHKPDDKEEHDRIVRAGGEVWEGRVNGNLNLSRAIGDLEYKTDKARKPEEQIISAKPDVREWDFQKEGPVELIIMGCDGIWECMENEKITAFFQQGLSKREPLKTLCERFLDTILSPNTDQLHGLDNMSLIVIQLPSK